MNAQYPMSNAQFSSAASFSTGTISQIYQARVPADVRRSKRADRADLIFLAFYIWFLFQLTISTSISSSHNSINPANPNRRSLLQAKQ